MKSFSVDWLGRCGPHDLVVTLTPEEIRDRLEISLIEEPSVESLLSTDWRYTGEVYIAAFTVRPCRRSRRFCPTLTGELHQEDGVTRVQFQIDADRRLFVGLALVTVGVLLVAIVSLGLRVGVPFPLCAMPVFVLVALVGAMLFAHDESSRLLQFFVGLFEQDRVE
jgi:hypothetical protein